MPNPLTDELTPEAKAELAAIFAEMRARFRDYDPAFQVKVNRARRPWEVSQ